MIKTIPVERTDPPNSSLLREELDGLSYGTYELLEPGNYPGQVIVMYPNGLTSQQEQDIIDTVTNHNASQLTAEQQREQQDIVDLDDLRAAHDNFDTLTDAEKESHYKKAIRMALRGLRDEPI